MQHDFRTPEVQQQGLFTNKPKAPHFDGPDYVPKNDQKRLTNQLASIRDYMIGHGQFRTLQEIADTLQFPENSVSANLRHLRKARFGAFTVNRRKRSFNLNEYQVTK